MGGSDRSSHSVKGKTLRLGRELDEVGTCQSTISIIDLRDLRESSDRGKTNLNLGSNMEESKITGNQMMNDSCGFVLSRDHGRQYTSSLRVAPTGPFIVVYDKGRDIPTRRSDHSKHIWSPRKYSVRVSEAQPRSYKTPT